MTAKLHPTYTVQQLHSLVWAISPTEGCLHFSTQELAECYASLRNRGVPHVRALSEALRQCEGFLSS